MQDRIRKVIERLLPIAGVLLAIVAFKFDDLLFRGFAGVAVLGVLAWKAELWRKEKQARLGDNADPPRAGLPPLVFVFVVCLLIALLNYINMTHA